MSTTETFWTSSISLYLRSFFPLTLIVFAAEQLYKSIRRLFFSAGCYLWFPFWPNFFFCTTNSFINHVHQPVPEKASFRHRGGASLTDWCLFFFVKLGFQSTGPGKKRKEEKKNCLFQESLWKTFFQVTQKWSTLKKMFLMTATSFGHSLRRSLSVQFVIFRRPVENEI